MSQPFELSAWMVQQALPQVPRSSWEHNSSWTSCCSSLSNVLVGINRPLRLVCLGQEMSLVDGGGGVAPAAAVGFSLVLAMGKEVGGVKCC